jgi:hypothetical protein
VRRPAVLEDEDQFVLAAVERDLSEAQAAGRLYAAVAGEEVAIAIGQNGYIEAKRLDAAGDLFAPKPDFAMTAMGFRGSTLSEVRFGPSLDCCNRRSM